MLKEYYRHPFSKEQLEIFTEFVFIGRLNLALLRSWRLLPSGNLDLRDVQVLQKGRDSLSENIEAIKATKSIGSLLLASDRSPTLVLRLTKMSMSGAIPVSPASEQYVSDLQKYLGGLQNTLDQILWKEQPNEEDFKAVHNFFSQYGTLLQNRLGPVGPMCGWRGMRN